MTKHKCPICGNAHRKLPRHCIEQTRDDHLHVVIAKLASFGASEQQAWSREATERWNRLIDYVKVQFDVDITADKGGCRSSAGLP